MSDIGRKILERRKALGLTLEEVGNAVGVGKSTVRKWENGMIKNMGRDKIEALAKVLNMDPLEFFQTSLVKKPDLPRVKLNVSTTKVTPSFGKETLRVIETYNRNPVAGITEVKEVTVDPQLKSMMKLWKVSSSEAKETAIQVLKTLNKKEK